MNDRFVSAMLVTAALLSCFPGLLSGRFRGLDLPTNAFQHFAIVSLCSKVGENAPPHSLYVEVMFYH